MSQDSRSEQVITMDASNPASPSSTAVKSSLKNSQRPSVKDMLRPGDSRSTTPAAREGSESDSKSTSPGFLGGLFGSGQKSQNRRNSRTRSTDLDDGTLASDLAMISDLKKQLKAESAARERAERDHLTLLRKHNNQTIEVEKLEKANKEFSERVRTAEGELRRHRQELAEKERQLESQAVDLAAQHAQHGAAGASASEQARDYQKLRELYNKSQTLVKQLEGELGASVEQLERFRTDHDRLADDKRRLEEDVARVNDAIRQKEASLARYSETEEQTAARMKALQEELAKEKETFKKKERKLSMSCVQLEEKLQNLEIRDVMTKEEIYDKWTRAEEQLLQQWEEAEKTLLEEVSHTEARLKAEMAEGLAGPYLLLALVFALLLAAEGWGGGDLSRYAL
uniref:Uncharacterized protein n=3 Tax=Heterosigma akashiwo TaxID=2829 RepID=A0A6V1RW37_HETAK|mmetsp:Transcript_8392/g.12840  ORF Transcript_8392/g.12840 Transcript_8392/m.12840 type:complete len:398 (-) Transcript_8392:446-1639(-)